MSVIVPHASRAAGTILTAALYNTDHVNHVTNALSLNTDKVEAARVVATTNGLQGGGDLGADRTLSIDPAGLVLLAGGTSFVVGADCKNNAATPNTKIDLDADAIVLRNSTNNCVIRFNPGAALTNDVDVAGPTENGRDQAAAFSASTWIHFYWIWNGTTLATLSSVVAPSTGPTLPSGYTHWAYAGPWRRNISNNLLKARIKGSNAFFEDAAIVLTDGTAVTETAVDVSGFVPPNALSYVISASKVGLTNTAAGAADIDIQVRIVTAVNYARIARFVVQGLTASVATTVLGGSVEVPNIGQSFFYIIILTAGTLPLLSIDVQGFKIPNGGE